MGSLMEALPMKRRKQTIAPYLYLIPCFAIFIAFVFYPFIRTIVLSFFLTDTFGNPVFFEGFDNYVRLFRNPHFHNSLRLTFIFAPMVGIPTFVVGYLLAAVANDRMRGSRLYEVMYSIPMAIATAPAATLWIILLTPGPNGIVNWLLGTEIRWLLDPQYALISVAVVTVWLNIGASFIFLLTGFRNVPQEIVESARIDGAGYFRRLFKITTPIASPQIFFVVFLNITTSFQAFGQIRLMTRGGPSRATEVMVYSIFENAIRFSRYDVAFSMSVILFLIILTITLIQFRIEDKVVHYK